MINTKPNETFDKLYNQKVWKELRECKKYTYKMRIFAVGNSERITLDISEGDTVEEVRERIRDVMCLGPDEGPEGSEVGLRIFTIPSNQVHHLFV